MRISAFLTRSQICFGGSTAEGPSFSIFRFSTLRFSTFSTSQSIAVYFALYISAILSSSSRHQLLSNIKSPTSTIFITNLNLCNLQKYPQMWGGSSSIHILHEGKLIYPVLYIFVMNLIHHFLHDIDSEPSLL